MANKTIKEGKGMWGCSRGGSRGCGEVLGVLSLPQNKLIKVKSRGLFPLPQSPRGRIGVGQREETKANAKGGH